MAKTTAPLLSFGANGQIAKTAVYASWRGIPYVRRHVVPSNPRTIAQQTTRTTFATLREMYKVLPQLGRDPWVAFARGRPFTGMNALVGENMRAVRGDPDFANFIGSPGANGGLSVNAVTITPGAAAGEATVGVTIDTIPDGWAVTRTVAVAFPNQDPAERFGGPLIVADDGGTPFAIDIAGFDAATPIVAAGWAEWVKPNGGTAYSVSLSATGVTA